MNKKHLLQSIQKLISKSYIEEAFQELATFLKKGRHNKQLQQHFTSLQANWNALKRNQNLGLLSFEEQRITRARIVAALLDLVGELEEEDKEQQQPEPQEDKAPSSVLKNVISGKLDNVGQVTVGDTVHHYNTPPASENTATFHVLLLYKAVENLDKEQLHKEHENIKAELVKATKQEFKVTICELDNIRTIEEDLLDHPPHYVHFSTPVELYKSSTDPIMQRAIHILQPYPDTVTSPIIKFLGSFRDTIICISINYTWNEYFIKSIKRILPDTIIFGTQANMYSERVNITPSVIQFSTRFYRAIAKGRTVLSAYSFAKEPLESSGNLSFHYQP